jgi:hypothetical protein
MYQNINKKRPFHELRDDLFILDNFKNYFLKLEIPAFNQFSYSSTLV